MRTIEMEIEIHPELESCLPAPSDQQLEQLRESLRTDGMISGVIPCSIAELPGKHFILDGHTRYREAISLGIVPIIDTDGLQFFETVAQAVQWICKFQAARRNLTSEQYNLLLGRFYKAVKNDVGANQHTSGRVDQIEPPSSTAEKVAAEFDVSPSKVKRSSSKVDKLESLGLDAAVMDGSVKNASVSVLTKIEKAIAAEPKRKDEIIQEAIEAAKANKGRLQAPKQAVDPEHEFEDDEPDDPAAEPAIAEFSETITTLIHRARREWDPESVAQLKKNLLDAFKTPLREMPPIIPATVA
ncbi:hypothetical protein GC170_21340 [bacterium]|nr:hypothetical protein [bacterium]